MNKTVEWALFVDTEGVNYLDVLACLKERLEYDEALKTMHLHADYGRTVYFENVIFSYKTTSMHVKISFHGEVKDFDNLFIKIIWDRMKNYIECIELDVPALIKTKRSMRLKVGDEMVERIEFGHMIDIVKADTTDIVNFIYWLMVGASLGLGVSTLSMCIAWIVTKMYAFSVVAMIDCAAAIIISLLAMHYKKNNGIK